MPSSYAYDEEEEDLFDQEGYYPPPMPPSQSPRSDFPTDWNVHLGITPPPGGSAPDRINLLQNLRIPDNATPQQAQYLLSMALMLQKRADQDHSEAMRWQGQQDYSRLYEQAVAAGDDEYTASRKAMAGSARKLFPNDPRGLVSSLRAIAPKTTPTYQNQGEPDVLDLGGAKFARTRDRLGNQHLIRITEPKSKITDLQDYKDLSEDIRVTLGRIKDLTQAQARFTAGGVAPEEDAVEEMNRLNSELQELRKQRKALFKNSGEEAPAEEDAAGEGERVKVKNASGQVGTIPKSQLEQALAQGYTLAN